VHSQASEAIRVCAMEVDMKIASIFLATTLSGMLLAAASAQADSAKGNDVCLDIDHVDHTVVVDDQTILYYMRGGKIWKNTLQRQCSSLKFEQGFVEDIRGGEVCSNRQTIRVIQTGALCSLGAFTPYTPPPKSAMK
jgi:hypothetical protein